MGSGHSPEYRRYDAWVQTRQIFAQNEFDEGDIPADEAPDDGKRPSQRLRAVLFHLVANTDQSEPFQRFYERWMDRRIQAIKDELS